MTASRPELSRPIDLERLPEGGLSLAIVADPAERERLARRLDLVELTRLEAHVTVDRLPGELVRVRGDAAADLQQSCIVTLEPVAQALEFALERLFGPGGDPDSGEIVLDPDTLDIEPLDGPRLDLGELVAEELALALDPYPRAPGAEAPAGKGEPETGPFAALEALRRRS